MEYLLLRLLAAQTTQELPVSDLVGSALDLQATQGDAAVAPIMALLLSKRWHAAASSLASAWVPPAVIQLSLADTVAGTTTLQALAPWGLGGRHLISLVEYALAKDNWPAAQTLLQSAKEMALFALRVGLASKP